MIRYPETTDELSSVVREVGEEAKVGPHSNIWVGIVDVDGDFDDGLQVEIVYIDANHKVVGAEVEGYVPKDGDRAVVSLHREHDKEINLSRRGSIEKMINGAVRNAVLAHGPITTERAPSVAKRVIAAIKQYNRHVRKGIEPKSEG